MGVFTADHIISPRDRFAAAIRSGLQAAERFPESLITFGITPDSPHTGYGYVQRGEQVTAHVFRAREFKEKPTRKIAEAYVKSGEYYWNSGIFCWRITTILNCLKQFTPKLHEALERIAGAIATPAETTVLREAYEPLEKISIDYAVMEKAETIRVVEADFEWSDVGSWESVARLRRAEADERGNVLIGRCEMLEASDSLVIGDEDHLIGVIGLEDVIVVHTPDATLVCAKERAEEVKQLVDRLERKGLDKYL